MIITRPHGWGKSVNVDMLRRFLQIEVNAEGVQLAKDECQNYKLFVGGTLLEQSDNKNGHMKLLKPLKISRYGNYMGLQGEFPVIAVSFGTVRANTYQRVAKQMKETIANLFRRHNYLGESTLNQHDWNLYRTYCSGNFNDNQLEESLNFLSKLLCSHFQQKVYILIDDYDVPVVHLMYELAVKMRARCKTVDDGVFFDKIFESLDFDHTLSLIQGTYVRCLFDNKALQKALLTGTVLIEPGRRLAADAVRYTLAEREFGDFYGFSQEEVDQLLTEVRFNKNNSPLLDRESLKSWYGGYNFAGKVKYTAASLVDCLRNGGKLYDYARPVSNSGIVDFVFSSERVQSQLRDLLSGNGLNVNDTERDVTHCTIPVNVTERGLTSLLFYNGYLNPHHIFKEKRLSVPNRETETILKMKILKYTCQRLNLTSKVFASTAKRLANFEMDQFQNELRQQLSAIPRRRDSQQQHSSGSQQIHTNHHESHRHNFNETTTLNLCYTGIAWSLSYFLEKDYLMLVDKVTPFGKIEFLSVSRLDSPYRNAIIAKGRITKSMKYAKRSVLTGFSSFGRTKIGPLSNIDLKRYKHVQQILWISFAFGARNLTLNYKIESPSA